MFYPCLVVDHDDTVVNSSAMVHYPCFVEYCAQYFPDISMDFDTFYRLNFDPGVLVLFRDIVGMTPAQMEHEQEYWKAYVRDHVPQAYPGIAEVLKRQKAMGGRVCVVSHSYSANILRDYRENGLPEPDMVFGWEYPAEQRKPNPYPLYRIMETYGCRPEEMLMLDDLKPGYDMARAAGVPFAAAGWATDIGSVESYMRQNSDIYFKTIPELYRYLFEGDASHE